MWTLEEEGSQIGEISVEDMVAAQEAVAATLNISMVCMINKIVTCCSEQLMVY